MSPLFTKRTPEEQAAEDARKAREHAAAEARKQAKEALVQERKQTKIWEKAIETFHKSPTGQARRAFERGDHLFQVSFDVQTQQAIVIHMVGASTSQSTTDPTEVLNAICREGWELVTGSFIFIEEGSQSRDKFMSSGQNVAVKGHTEGYYLFRRCPENRVPSGPETTPTAQPAVPAPREEPSVAGPDGPTS